MLDIVNTTFIEGKLKLTRYKLVFIPYERVRVHSHENGSSKKKNDYEYVAKKLEPHRVRYFNIPLHMIYSVKDQWDKKHPELFFFDILTKDYRAYRVKIMPVKEGFEVYDSIRNQAFPGMFMTSWFVTKYKYQIKNYLLYEEEKIEDTVTSIDKISLSKAEKLESIICLKKLPEDGWNVYNYQHEYYRQGISKSNKDFRRIACWSMKSDINLCGTYPHFVFIPANVTDSELKKWALHRSKNRFPALSYFHKETRTSMWRCAQAKTGILSK